MQCDMRHKHNAVPSRTSTYIVVHALQVLALMGAFQMFWNAKCTDYHWAHAASRLLYKRESFESLLVNSWLHNGRGATSGIYWVKMTLHISTHLHTTPHISTLLHISPHNSTHFHCDYHKKHYKRDCNDSHSQVTARSTHLYLTSYYDRQNVVHFIESEGW